jgi:outer membrane protein/protease secretion system outer membrane protein
MEFDMTFAAGRARARCRAARLVGACAVLAGVGFPAWSLDLRQAYDAALANDATIRAARSQADATREYLPQAQAQRRPNVSLSAGRNYNDLTSKTQNFQGRPAVVTTVAVRR